MAASLRNNLGGIIEAICNTSLTETQAYTIVFVLSTRYKTYTESVRELFGLTDEYMARFNSMVADVLKNNKSFPQLKNIPMYQEADHPVFSYTVPTVGYTHNDQIVLLEKVACCGPVLCIRYDKNAMTVEYYDEISVKLLKLLIDTPMDAIQHVTFEEFDHDEGHDTSHGEKAPEQRKRTEENAPSNTKSHKIQKLEQAKPRNTACCVSGYSKNKANKTEEILATLVEWTHVSIDDIVCIYRYRTGEGVLIEFVDEQAAAGFRRSYAHNKPSDNTTIRICKDVEPQRYVHYDGWESVFPPQDVVWDEQDEHGTRDTSKSDWS